MSKVKSCVVIVHLFLFYCSTSSSSAQQLVYKVEYHSDSIGYMTATRSTSGQTTTYELVSKAKLKFLMSFDLYSHYMAEFEDNSLTTASSKNYLNDKKQSVCDVKWADGRYIINVDDEQRTENTPIRQSIASMYFEKPLSSNIFSEKYGAFCSVLKVNSDKYELNKPDNRKNTYYFKNGICEKVEIDLKMATIFLVRIK